MADLRYERELVIPHLGNCPVLHATTSSLGIKPVFGIFGIETADCVDTPRIFRRVDVAQVVSIVKPQRDKWRQPSFSAAFNEDTKHIPAI